MGISFGSTGIKPYVGSKEVQEAYVGSQLVYRSGPPTYYAFLGAENNYVLADWCKLVQRVSAVKESGIYRLGLQSTEYNVSTRGLINITEIKGNKFKFIAKRGGSTSDNITNVYFYNSSGSQISKQQFNAPSNDYAPFSFNVPQTTAKITITGPYARYQVETIYLDAIRFEVE